jgi:hypothetical protein
VRKLHSTKRQYDERNRSKTTVADGLSCREGVTAPPETFGYGQHHSAEMPMPLPTSGENMSNTETRSTTSARALIERRAKQLTVLACVAAATISCSAVDDDIITSATSAQTENTIKVSVAHTSKSYTYQVTQAAPIATPDTAAVAVKPIKVAALGLSPYICTPSGFGQTARCVLR